MSKRDDKIELYVKDANKLGLNLSEDLIAKVTIGLGPSIYNKDAETVACSQATEMDRVKKSYLQKKLGLTKEDEATLAAAIKEVCEKMGSSNKTKYRALFYALLCQKFKKESVYV